MMSFSFIKKIMPSSFLCLLLISLFNSSAFAADALTGAVDKQPLNIPAIIIFGIFVLFTLWITWWASRRSKSRSEFYTAGGGITPFQNGVAISGDLLSAASLLGFASGFYYLGVDCLLLVAGTVAAWPLILVLITERMRNLGRYTFIDVISYRFSKEKIKPIAAIASLMVLVFYLIGQIVGAGKLIQLLFGLDYTFAVITVSTLMVCYVVFGGMLAATWVQFIKAVLLILGGTVMAILVLNKFDFNVLKIFEEAVKTHPKGSGILEVRTWMPSTGAVISTGLTLVVGFLGLPHILMRLFTVKDARAARQSALYAVSIIGFFQFVIIIIGFGAISLIMFNPDYHDAAGNLIGGKNMVVLHAAHFVGGNILFGFIAAVAFATILAVVSGLTISAAATISHDLYAGALAKGKVNEKTEMMISKMAIIAMGVLGVITGIAFENQNVVFVTTLALSIAASANAPVLLLSMFWRKLTTRGTIAGIVVGLVSSVTLIILGPLVWKNVLGYAEPIFPYAYPTIVTLPLTVIIIWLVSITDKSKTAQKEQAAFDEMFVVSETGLGVSTASKH